MLNLELLEAAERTFNFFFPSLDFDFLIPQFFLEENSLDSEDFESTTSRRFLKHLKKSISLQT